jgi:hypothetical protein
MRPETARSPSPEPVGQEAVIRTLSVSLLAVAAIAASLFLGRHREAPTTPDTDTTSAARQLDAIRAAGL